MKIINLSCEHMTRDILIDTKHPVFSFALSGAMPDQAIDCYRIIVATSRTLAEKGKGDVWDSGALQGGDPSRIRYRGEELKSRGVYYFIAYAKVGDHKLKSGVSSFICGLFRHAEWGCGFIGPNPAEMPKYDCPEKDKVGFSAPYLRRTLTISKPVRRAVAFATACGAYEFYVNGAPAADYVLAPQWTDYGKSIQYQAYDLTEKLNMGENVLGAIVGDGWFFSNICSTGRGQYSSNDAPGFMMNMRIEYEDGTRESVVTDGTWKVAFGAYLYTDNQNGECYDARKEPVGWNDIGYDDSMWAPAQAVAHAKCFGTRFKASMAPQIKEILTIDPITVGTDRDGRVIVDMGQNMVGCMSLRLRGAAGTVVTIRHGEMLKDDGTLYTENLRTALQTDTFILSGGDDTYHPRFTFHGFRYAEISGLDYIPKLSDIKGHVLSSDCMPTGSIETSDPMVNKLFSNALWGQRGNFLGVPTDCPQRDERMGWTGDAQVFCKSACYNMDCYAFYNKYMEDLVEAQKPNGAVTDVVPAVKFPNGWDIVGNGNAAWGDAVFVIPYTVYEMYGDREIIRKYYPAMQKYFRFLLGSTHGLLRPDFGYGDWLSVGEETPKDVLATAFFAYDAKLLSKMAEILGKPEDAAYYADMFEKIRRAWCDAYVEPGLKIKGDTQCCYVLALKMDLVGEKERPLAARRLVAAIRRQNDHLSTGFVGVSYLLPVLCDAGYTDLAYRLLLNKTYPSWGYSIENGATTIWERWNSYTKETGFGDVGMNSFNHYSLGSVVEWMYGYMGGIKPLSPGFSEILIRPYFSHRIHHVRVAHMTPYGEVVSEWENIDGGFRLTVHIPPNGEALVALDPDVTITTEDIAATEEGFRVGSGVYTFTVLNKMDAKLN